VNFHPRAEDIQVARNDAGDHMGWIGKIGEGYTWIVPAIDGQPSVTPAPHGLMSLSPHSGDGNFTTREEAHRMLTGMFERPATYGFMRENWSVLCP
jgi:hypothetical protein